MAAAAAAPCGGHADAQTGGRGGEGHLGGGEEDGVEPAQVEEHLISD